MGFDLYGVSMGPGEYLNFGLAFSRTGKLLKMVGGPGKPWGAVRWENQTTEKYFMCIMGPGINLSEAWKSPEKVNERCH